jgi:hypothetical protein
MHQESPTTYKIGPPIFNRNVIRVSLAESNLAGQSFFLGLFLGGTDVGGSNVHSDDFASVRYEVG